MTPLISELQYKQLLELQVETTKLFKDQMAGLAARRRKAKPSAAIMRPTAAAAVDPIGGLGERTLAEYRRRGGQLLQDAQVHDLHLWDMVEARCSGTPSWRTARASLQVVLLESVRATKREIDSSLRLYKAGPFTQEDKDRVIAKMWELDFHAFLLKSMPERHSAPNERGNKKRKRNTKALSLRGLPVDWREQIAAKLVSDTRLPWLVQAVCGCRSQELKWGVTVCLSDDRREVSFEIRGAKGSEFAGQEWRRFCVPTDSPVVRRLVAEFGEPGCRIVSTDLELPTFAARISSAGKKLWPERDAVHGVSPYSARHQVKADMKARGMSDVEIAAVMGHSTTRSHRYYGGFGKAAGSVAPTKIETARKVKVKAGYSAKDASSPAPITASAKSPEQKAATAVRRKMRP